MDGQKLRKWYGFSTYPILYGKPHSGLVIGDITADGQKFE